MKEPESKESMPTTEEVSDPTTGTAPNTMTEEITDPTTESKLQSIFKDVTENTTDMALGPTTDVVNELATDRVDERTTETVNEETTASMDEKQAEKVTKTMPESTTEQSTDRRLNQLLRHFPNRQHSSPQTWYLTIHPLTKPRCKITNKSRNQQNQSLDASAKKIETTVTDTVEEALGDAPVDPAIFTIAQESA